MLFTAGMVNRLGKVDDGTSVTDYDEEEIQRKFSISATLAYADWGKAKINFIDTPGYNIFLHETEAALMAADSALLLVHGVAGVEVQTEKTWGFCEKLPSPARWSSTRWTATAPASSGRWKRCAERLAGP